jgi:hypothetical protein
MRRQGLTCLGDALPVAGSRARGLDVRGLRRARLAACLPLDTGYKLAMANQRKRIKGAVATYGPWDWDFGKELNPDKWWLELDEGPWVSFSRDPEKGWLVWISTERVPEDQRDVRGDAYIEVSLDGQVLIDRTSDQAPAPAEPVDPRVEEVAKKIWATSGIATVSKTWEATPYLWKNGYRRQAAKRLRRNPLIWLRSRRANQRLSEIS